MRLPAILLALALCGCLTRKPPQTASTAALRGSLVEARASSDRIGQHLQGIGTAADRIEAKNVVILRWLQSHP